MGQQLLTEQLIGPGDKISFILKSRDGYELVDVLESTVNGNVNLLGGVGSITYLVREDGNCEFPLLGDIKVQGMTRKQLEDLLEKKYSNIYNDPFIILTVTNRRVLVFVGRAGASVVTLPTENTKIIEILALIGGIHDGAKSNKIKIIRGDYKNPIIKKLDLSTIAGLKDCDFVVQPNDLIIIDPVVKPIPAILTELGPVLSLISVGLTFYLLFKK